VIFPRNITTDQARDSGMALLLICLIAGYFFSHAFIIPLSILLVLVNMTLPKLFSPFAFLWLGISNILGMLMSRLILGLVYYLLVTPVGVLRKITGWDPMQVKKWKNGQGSVFISRDHLFETKEIEKPF
jgi:uncharacterized membrane protein YgdD (TMEM256/DUF423 family)